MPTFRTYRVGKNFVTIDIESELEPLAWDSYVDISVEQAVEIEEGALPSDIIEGLAELVPE
jgi:hypothetical protein